MNNLKIYHQKYFRPTARSSNGHIIKDVCHYKMFTKNSIVLKYNSEKVNFLPTYNFIK